MPTGTSARPTARGVVVLGLGAGATLAGLWAGYGGLVGLGLALLALVGVSAASVLVPVPLVVERELSRSSVPRLDACEAVVRLTNGSSWLPLTLDGAERVGDRDLPLPVAAAALRPGATVEMRVDVPTVRRGTVPVGPLTLTRQGLLGLAAARSRHGRAVQVTVLPRLLVASGPPPGVRRGHAGADERVEHGGTDLVGLREYVPGDDLRRLHWATSARTGTLMVREDADPSQPHLTVLVDDRATSYDGDAFEEAVDTAASLTAAALADGSPVRVMTATGGLDLDLPAGLPGDGAARALSADLVTALAALTPAGDLPAVGHEAALDRASSGRGGAGPHHPDVVALVSGAAAGTAELVLAADGAPHGVVLVVDRSPERVVDVAGRTTVLSGPRAEDLCAAWSAVAS